MVLIALPLLKLSLLGMRQLSRPVSNFIRMEAKQSKFFRNHICMPTAQLYHRCEVTVKMLLLNLGRPIKIEPLNEATAIELGSEILGELVVFVVAAVALVAESGRQLTKSKVEMHVNINHKTILEALRVLEHRQERQRMYFEEIGRAFKELGKPIELNNPIKRKDSHDDKLFKSFKKI